MFDPGGASPLEGYDVVIRDTLARGSADEDLRYRAYEAGRVAYTRGTNLLTVVVTHQELVYAIDPFIGRASLGLCDELFLELLATYTIFPL